MIGHPMTWNHRLTVVVPMHALGLVDDAVGLVTLGFVQPDLALSWAFRRSTWIARKREEVEP